MRIGFIGLGNMGAPLARRLVPHGGLTVHDRDPAAARALAAENVVSVSTPAEVGARSDLVLTCLPTSAHVEEVIFGADGVASTLAADGIVVDMTTGDPACTRDMAARLAETDRHLVDAPVSGGPRGANEGTIAIMVGASDALLARVKPVLDRISVNVVHAGAVGAGHAIKAGNNLLNLVCRLATFEVVSMLVRDGVDPERAVAIIQKSSGRNYATEITLPDNILSGKMHQGFTVGLMRKDASLALDIARAVDAPMPLGNLARELLQVVHNAHGANADMSAVALTYEQLTGARIRPTP
ncbi:MAG: NAD(P)-dependent oxidoreductase [Ectothiorhodospiraceae bacterium]|nr:NAD(P)-dependent oxidoreductase [Ectothiorhodospiraceae bacterium]